MSQFDRVENARSVSALVDEMQRLEETVAALERDLREAKRNLRTLTEQTIPDALLAAGGLTHVEFEDGTSLSVRPVYAGSITEERRDAAHAWLRANGHGDLIKSELTIQLGTGEQEAQRQIAGLAADMGVPVKHRERVHPQTLGAFIREQTESGKPVPDVLGPFVGNRAKLNKGE